jgi:hypothetical protein
VDVSTPGSPKSIPEFVVVLKAKGARVRVRSGNSMPSVERNREALEVAKTVH